MGRIYDDSISAVCLNVGIPNVDKVVAETLMVFDEYQILDRAST